MRTDVVVLGAGPAGLGAGYRVAQAGRSVVILERAGRVGGAAGSLCIGGVRADHGSHRLHPTTEPRILATLRGLLGDDLQRRSRNGRIRLADRWIAFPLRTGDLVRRLPPDFVIAAARDGATWWARRPRAPTFAEILRAGLGPAMCEHFYFPYARKIWGVEPEQLSAEQARRRVTASSPAKLAHRIARAAWQRPWFWYPRRGFGSIAEALADAAVAAGADLRLETAVEGIEVSPTGVTVTVAGGGTVEADRAWSTLPVTALAHLAGGACPPTVADAAAALSYRSMLLIYLLLGIDRYTPFDAHYIPAGHTPVTRVSEPKNYRDGDDPPDRTVLCAEIPCDRDGPLWGASDEELAGIVSDGLAECDLPRATPVEVMVRRLPFAYPIYLTGYEEAFDRLDSWASSLGRVLTFGRQGLFAHDNTHHALAMAWDAADALRPDGTFDHTAWDAARGRFAQHVVED